LPNQHDQVILQKFNKVSTKRFFSFQFQISIEKMFGVGVAFHVKAMCLTIYSTKKVLTKNNLNNQKKKLELRRKSSISLDHPAHTCPCEKKRLNEEKRKKTLEGGVALYR
jgi:hypothetical protein